MLLRRNPAKSRWSALDDVELKRLYDEEKRSPTQIATQTRRTVAAVAGRLTKLRKEGRVGPARGRGGRTSTAA